MKIQELSEAFTQEGVNKLKVGQLLRFSFENSMNEYIITKLNKKSGKVFARPVRTYDQSEVMTEDVFGDKDVLDLNTLDEDITHA